MVSVSSLTSELSFWVTSDACHRHGQESPSDLASPVSAASKARLVCLLVACLLVRWFTCLLVAWFLVCWLLASWFVGLLVGCLLVGWLVCLFVGWFACLLVAWLAA